MDTCSCIVQLSVCMSATFRTMHSWHRYSTHSYCTAVYSLHISYTPFTRYNRLSKRLYNQFDNRLYRVNKRPTGCQTFLTTGWTFVYRLWNQLSNRFDNRVERIAVHSTGCQTGLYNRFHNRLYIRYSWLSNRLSNGFDNWLNVYTIQPVVKPVW